MFREFKENVEVSGEGCKISFREGGLRGKSVEEKKS